MSDIDPVEVTNLDIYGNPPLDWHRARTQLISQNGPDVTYFLSTLRPDGRPHIAGVGALWFEGDLYVVSGEHTRKSKNLAANPLCAIAARLPGIDITLEGSATRSTDLPTLERLARRFQESGWPAEVDAAARGFTAPYSAPSAGPPPWQVYRFAFDTAFGVASQEPYGATRWRFARG
jgi:pyridoxamine 5'-phosphate oxidase-like protein